ncbi:putative glycosyl [Phaeomoniella chlamydospora]|uniref:Putative glycosyl n=1 Tax=Phaeomoniella chlamydospora TaxID=158046 RepID=A0A0G2GXT7_PHACM|nr:putative glycosyl [Phaeomoniella chlamydospora]
MAARVGRYSPDDEDWNESYPDLSDQIARPTNPYARLRQQEPPQRLVPLTPQRQEWAQRSLSDLYPESLPETPSLGTPLRPLTPNRSSVFLAASRSQTSLAHSTAPLYADGPTGYFTSERIKEGAIARLHERDDVGFLPTWKRYLYKLAPFLTVLTLALYWLYFGLRIYCVQAAQEQENRTFPLAWIFIGIEISVAVPVFLQSIWSVFILKKRKRPKYRLLGNAVPSVDVFITCCGEDDDLVMDTVRAACDIDYPLEKFRVIVLDDGKSDNLKASVNDLAASTCPNAMYMRRPKFPGVPHHFKAGNLNYGIEETHNLPGGPGELIAALDADMLPERDWLRAIIPHLLIDDRMALACPPQLFYNVPAGDPLCQSLDFFVHVSEPIKDALGVAWCTGSGYVVKRHALEEINGFPLGSLAEDVATSTLLLGRGYKTAYVHEALQYGTVPETFSGHLKQRTRWAIGTVDTSFKLKFYLFGDNIRRLTVAQRLSSFCYAVMGLFNIVLVMSIFAMPVVLIINQRLVAYANDNQLRWLIRACFASIAVNRLCELALFIPSGYTTGQRGARAQLWMSPYIALTIIRSFVLPTWLGGQTQAFKPSGSLKSDLNERDPVLRAPMYRRLRVIIFNNLAFFHIAYVYFCLVAVVISTYRCFIKEDSNTRETIICLLTHAFWPPLTWIITVSAFWIPITYACDPPTMSTDRETYLNRDPKTGVAHPTPKSKKIGFKTETAYFEFEYTATTAFTTLVFVASFFF